MDEVRLIQKRANVHFFALAQVCFYKFPYRQYTYNIINAALVHGKAAVRFAAYGAEHLIDRIVDVKRDYVHARGKYTLDRRFRKLQSRAYKLAALLIEAALFGHILNDIVYLILGDGYLRIGLGKLCGEIAYRRQQRCKRLENGHEKPQRTGNRQRQPLAVFLRDALGQHLAGKEHDQRHYKRADRNRAAYAREHARYRKRSYARRGKMYDICAYEYARYRKVKVVEHLQRPYCFCLAALGADLYPDLGDRGKRGLRHGKIRRAQDKQNYDYQRQSTGIVHFGSNTLHSWAAAR